MILKVVHVHACMCMIDPMEQASAFLIYLYDPFNLFIYLLTFLVYLLYCCFFPLVSLEIKIIFYATYLL